MTTETKEEPKAKEEPQATDKPQTIADIIAKRADAFNKVATQYLSADKLVRLAQLMVAKSPKLAKSTPLSVIDALMTCAKLGLEPNEPGGVWLVPFENKYLDRGQWKKALVCTTIVDYRGLLDVARRSGEIANVHADVRYANDQFYYGVDTSAPTMVSLKHIPADGDRGEIVGVYFAARLKNGETHVTYLTKAEVEGFRKRSRNATGNDSPWTKDWAAMAKKTACRRGVNWLPKSPDIQLLREVLNKEDEIDLEPGDYSVSTGDEITMPKRLSDRKPSPSPGPVDSDREDDVAADAPDDGIDDDRVGVATLRSVQVKKGERPVWEVVDTNGVVYRVTDPELVPVLEKCAQSKERVSLSANGGVIEEIFTATPSKEA